MSTKHVDKPSNDVKSTSKLNLPISVETIEKTTGHIIKWKQLEESIWKEKLKNVDLEYNPKKMRAVFKFKSKSGDISLNIAFTEGQTFIDAKITEMSMDIVLGDVILTHIETTP